MSTRRTPTPETRYKLRMALLGRPRPECAMKGEKNGHFGKPVPDEIKERVRSKLVGRQFTDEHKAKISAAISGEHHPRWKGGISFEPYCPKFNDNLKTRVRNFFGNECVLCGKSEVQNGVRLSVHHVEYNKLACCDGKPVTFAALCKCCHSKTGSDRTRWENIIHIIIDNIYNGRSYFTQEEFQSKLPEAIASGGDMKEIEV